jgi:hypothetical protein
LIYDDYFEKSRINQEFFLSMSYCNDAVKGYNKDATFYDMFYSRLRKADIIRSYIIRQAHLSHLTKYGYINTPIITKEEIPLFVERANQGDLVAMFELRRYYDFPRDDYDPEKTMSRYWLFKAIEAGDENAMLEAGYERPYSVRTQLKYRDVNISLDVSCEGVVRSDSFSGPACFLYTLFIGPNSPRNGHIILDENHVKSGSIRPQFLALKEISDQVLIELTSYPDNIPTEYRQDYFDLDGRYLGSNKADNSSAYFWNYRLSSFPPISSVIDASKGKDLLQTKIRRWPYVEAFLFWEREFPKQKRLTALDNLIMLTENESAATETDQIRERIDKECHQVRDNMWQELQYGPLFYDRLNKLITLDLYEEMRLNNRDKSTLTPLELDLLRVRLTKYFCPSKSARDTFSRMEHPEEAYDAYEKLDERPSYIAEYGSENPAIRILQICRYVEKNSTFLKAPCFAAQVRFKTDIGYKYHYIINSLNFMIPNNADYNEISPLDMMSTDIHERKLEDNKSYFILFSNFWYSIGFQEMDNKRIDVFDDKFNYLGSNNVAFSTFFISNAKQLPLFLDKQINSLKFQISLYYDPDYKYYMYPEPSDIIFFQRYFSNNRNPLQ